MPRNASSVYTLPGGNPVVPGTNITSAWANTTMSDIATALTQSLSIDGSTSTANLTNKTLSGGKFVNSLIEDATLKKVVSPLEIAAAGAASGAIRLGTPSGATISPTNHQVSISMNGDRLIFGEVGDTQRGIHVDLSTMLASGASQFWHTQNLVKTTSVTDQVAGHVVLVGDYGVGRSIIGTELNFDLYNVPGNYISPLSDFFPKPAGWINGRNIFPVFGGINSGYLLQMIAGGSSNQNRIAFRTGTGAAPSTWTNWNEFWHSANLVKTATALDTTAGSMLKVADFGIGATTAVTPPNIEADPLSHGQGMYTIVANSIGNPGGLGAQSLFVDYRRGTVSANMIAQSISTGAPRMFQRSFSASAWGSWVEYWSTANLVKQTAQNDTTAGAVLLNGAHGIGSQWISSDLDMNSYTVGGKYITPATSLTNLPPGWAIGRHTMDVTGGSAYATQLIAGGNVNRGQFAMRSWNAATWTSWAELWTTQNLARQTSALDGSDGAVYQMFAGGTGSFGLGKLAYVVSNANSVTWQGFGKNSGLGAANFPNAGISTIIGFPHAVDMTSLGAQLAVNFTNDSGSYITLPRIFARCKTAAGTFGNWGEVPLMLAANTWAGQQSFDGFTSIGDLCPLIKMKKLTVTTGASQGSTVTVAHGVTFSKIISFEAILDQSASAKIKPGLTGAGGFEYNVQAGTTTMSVTLAATNSANVVSKVCTIFLIYEA